MNHDGGSDTAQRFAVGQPVRRTEDSRLLKGGGRFLGDINLPGQAHAHILRSPHAHARIGPIDTARAAAAPGVLAVLTGADARADGLGDLVCSLTHLKRGEAPMYLPSRPLLAVDRVRLVGDPVAVVVADTVDRAKDAADLIDVD